MTDSSHGPGRPVSASLGFLLSCDVRSRVRGQRCATGAQLPHRARSEAPAINSNLLLATSGTGGPRGCRRIGEVYQKARWSAPMVDVGQCFSGLPVSMALSFH